jgi:hypothetical protein
VVGEEPIQVWPDVEGDIGGPGTFSGTIPWQNTNCHGTQISHRDGLVHGAASATD